MEFEKTNPILIWANRRKLLYERDIWQYIDLWGTKKQSQFIRAAFGDNEFEKTKPIVRIWLVIRQLRLCSRVSVGPCR